MTKSGSSEQYKCTVYKGSTAAGSFWPVAFSAKKNSIRGFSRGFELFKGLAMTHKEGDERNEVDSFRRVCLQWGGDVLFLL